jgi:hypothetical protein
MADQQLMDEELYSHTRGEQLLDRLESSTRLSRRQLLAGAAAGIPLLAGLGRWAPRGAAAEAAPAPPPPIRKPLPPEWFVPFGTNAEMRWEAMSDQGYAVPNERFFVRNHTPRPRSTRTPGACGCSGPACATRGGRVVLPSSGTRTC